MKLNKITPVILLLCTLFGVQAIYSQEALPESGNSNSYHNQLFFNRFLINPTFSLVRENKSYLNILHRNQYATFEDNSQNYYLGFSGKLNENAAMGIGVYSQWAGVIQQFGFNANYATAVQLGEKSKLTFGTNLTYFNEGLDKNRAIAIENDNQLIDAQKESKLALQPGMTLTVGSFDFGVYATDLVNYNQTTNEFLTSFSEKTVKASLQYTHDFSTNRGLFANGRLMPLVQLGKNLDGSLDYVGSILLDLPSYGWLQSTIDDTYGVSVGAGINLSKKMSIGYLMEKSIAQQEADLGWNHEVSLAYTFADNNNKASLISDASQDARIDDIIRNYEEQILHLKGENKASESEDSLEESREEKKTRNRRTAIAATTQLAENSNRNDEDTNSLAYQNSLILDELMLRQDSIEKARTMEFEKRFEMLIRTVRNEIRTNLNPNATEFETPNNTLLAKNEAKSATTTKKEAVQAPIKTTKVAANVPQNTKSEVVSNKNTQVNEDVATDTKVHRAIEQRAVVVKNEGIANAEAPIVKADEKPYMKLPIKVLGNSNVIGVDSGYYVIANVYKTEKYLKSFMASLSEQGIEAKQFYNKENGLYYVYLANYNFKSEAQMAYISNLNGKYDDEKWIMQVDNQDAVVNNMFVD